MSSVEVILVMKYLRGFFIIVIILLLLLLEEEEEEECSQLKLGQQMYGRKNQFLNRNIQQIPKF